MIMAAFYVIKTVVTVGSCRIPTELHKLANSYLSPTVINSNCLENNNLQHNNRVVT